MKTTETLLILSLLTVFYTYLGYGMIAFLLVKLKQFFKPKRTFDSHYEPSVTFFVAAYNEENYIVEKAINSLSLDYPKEKIQYLFVTDGSTDRTPEILRKYDQFEVLHENKRGGKIGALNRGMKHAKNEIVIFSDANALLNKESIREIVKHYQYADVGCVAGEKRVTTKSLNNAAGAGEGIYWKYESFLKNLDYQLSTAVGAAGELFSIRKELYEKVEADTILDDFMISMRIAGKGLKIAYEPNAYASEDPSTSIENEAKRKVRISAGGIQSTFRLIPLLNPFKHGWLSFQLISHRILRWTLAPLALLMLFGANLYLWMVEGAFGALLGAQTAFYLSALLGAYFESRKIKVKMLFVPFYFAFMNFNMFRGMIRFLKNEQSVLWEKARA